MSVFSSSIFFYLTLRTSASNVDSSTSRTARTASEALRRAEAGRDALLCGAAATRREALPPLREATEERKGLEVVDFTFAAVLIVDDKANVIAARGLVEAADAVAVVVIIAVAIVSVVSFALSTETLLLKI